MQSFEVVVEKDHIERLTKTKPLTAISELIWNAYDADATKVTVSFEEGVLSALGLIRVADNGTGIPVDEAEESFKSLGGSWKRRQRISNGGRAIHGLKGQGRLKAFALGNSVTWRSYCQGKEFAVRGQRENLKQFVISETAETSRQGCVVEITDIEKDFEVRRAHNFDEAIRDVFALQLFEDRNFTIIYDDQPIDAGEAISHVTPYEVTAVCNDGTHVTAKLEIVEWKKQVQRKLMLCLPGRFSFHEVPPGIQARGHNFTAYLTSDYFQELADDNREGLAELDGKTASLVDAAKNALRKHFREREAIRSREKIEQWKKDGVYPYSGPAQDPIERNERQLFDVVALNLADYSAEFENSSKKNRQLVMQLLKAAVETGPAILPDLLAEVINLPLERQEEMASLLEKTSLSAVIESAKAVTDRLDFLKALQILIFDPTSKRQLLERSQLHRLLAQNTWVFGEQFNLMNDDEDLTAVLRSHLSLLGDDRTEVASVIEEKVLDTNGKNAIVDLMLSQRVPLPSDEKRQHLVVELKRPSQPVNDKVLHQIENYAAAVSEDSRFKGTDVEWDFVAISNDITPSAQRKVTQANRPSGLLFEFEDPKVRVWAKTWGQVIQEAEGRLTFYRRKLGYQADDASALAYLSRMDPDLLSPEVRTRIEELRAAG